MKDCATLTYIAIISQRLRLDVTQKLQAPLSQTEASPFALPCPGLSPRPPCSASVNGVTCGSVPTLSPYLMPKALPQCSLFSFTAWIITAALKISLRALCLPLL